MERGTSGGRIGDVVPSITIGSLLQRCVGTWLGFMGGHRKASRGSLVAAQKVYVACSPLTSEPEAKHCSVPTANKRCTKHPSA